MTTKYSELPLSELTIHPKNPRRKAVPDDELVASIKQDGLVQPLVVAPAAAAGDGYVIIAGHRRHAAAKKARLKTLPCIVREDLSTEADQVKAMLLENSSRVDLSPIEEAEGYQALIDLGLKQKDIAQFTGRAPRTVSERLRILRLAASTKKKVHAGQITIDDALGLVEFADDPAATKKLEAAAGTSDFKRVISHARVTRKALAEILVRAAALEQDGIEKKYETDHNSTWEARREAGCQYLTQFRDDDEISEATRTEHATCLAYGVDLGGSWSTPAIELVCSDPQRHASDDDIAAAEERARQLAERREVEAREATRRMARLDTITEDTATVVATLGPAGIAFLHATLPALGRALAAHGRVSDDDMVNRLGAPGGEWSQYAAVGQRTWADFIDDMADASPARLARVLVELLAVNVDRDFTASSYITGFPVACAAARPYVELLEAMGHEWQDVEQELVDRLRPAEAEDGAA